MRRLVLSLSTAWMLTLAGCANRDLDSPPCGVSHVETSHHGLKVFFGKDVDEVPRNQGSTGLTVTRARSPGSFTVYAITHGQLEDKHSVESDYLLLQVGDTAGTFHGFGGCSYVVEDDEHGLYLNISGADGDISDATYSDSIRPRSIILAYKPPSTIAELRADVDGFIADMFATQDEVVISLATSSVKLGDPAWNTSDPNWSRVKGLVRRDYLADTAATRPSGRERADLWEKTVGLHLTELEIDELLRFYRSDVGKHFVLLQDGLDPIESDWQVWSLDRPHPTEPMPTMKQEVTPERNAIVMLALMEILIANSVVGAPAGDPPAEVAAISKWAAIYYGAELDRLFVENQSDIPAYQDFSRSPALLHLLFETRRAENIWSGSPQGERWKAAVSVSLGKHMAEWKAVIRSLEPPR